MSLFGLFLLDKYTRLRLELLCTIATNLYPIPHWVQLWPGTAAMFTRITTHFSIRLFSFGWASIRPERWRDKGASSLFWTLYRNDCDGGFIKSGDTVTPLLAEKNYLIPPRCLYDYWCDRDIAHLFIFFDIIGFSQTAIKSLFPETIPLCLSPGSAKAMAEIAAHSQSEVSLVAQWQCMTAISEGLMLALKALPTIPLARAQRLIADNTPVTPALQFIEANLTGHLTNHLLAAHCSMSEDYFVRQFRQHIGQTPTQYIQESRVKLASELLLFSELSLEEIASRTGFGNRHYFSRVFTRMNGTGPATFRKVRQGR